MEEQQKRKIDKTREGSYKDKPEPPSEDTAIARLGQSIGIQLDLETIGPILSPILAVATSLLLGAVLILFAGENPIVAYTALVKGAFGGGEATMRTIRWSVPLIVLGLSAAVAFRGGMFNVGIEGSLWIGAFAGTLAGIYITGLPAIIHIPLVIVVAAVAGGFWSWIPGVARAKYGVDEVVFTLMSNYIVVLGIGYLIRYYFLDTERLALSFAEPETRYIQDSAKLPWLNVDQRLSISIFIALALVLLFIYLFRKSIWGYENEMTGLNAIFSRFGGVPVEPVSVSAMTISGVLAGIAGILIVIGNYHKFDFRIVADQGFDGITVALMGKLHPIGVLFSALFFGALKNGGAGMELKTNVSRNIVIVIQGLVLLLVTAKYLFQRLGLQRGWSGEED